MIVKNLVSNDNSWLLKISFRNQIPLRQLDLNLLGIKLLENRPEESPSKYQTQKENSTHQISKSNSLLNDYKT